MRDKFIPSLFVLLALLAPAYSLAISVGDMTFSMPAEKNMVAKYVVNNNKSARLYRVDVRSIDRPGEKEISSRAADGELLFTPRQITLQPGESNFFKFFYHGPADDKERYYRVSFQEIPPQNRTTRLSSKGAVGMMPVITMDTILVVRPRKIHFEWDFERQKGRFENSGNTWFRLIEKPYCGSTETEGKSWYMRPGDIIHPPALKTSAQIYIVYNDSFIKVINTCN
ncbi:P pilus assembly protein, chaperone PapD [Kosakonia sacchari]|nr:P pilus assembly protein, chaperone PapD [Kosakonia sacchari]